MWFHSEIKDYVDLEHPFTLVLNSNDVCTPSSKQESSYVTFLKVLQYFLSKDLCWNYWWHENGFVQKKKGGCVNVTYLPSQNKWGELTVQISLCSALGSLCVSSCSLACVRRPQFQLGSLSEVGEPIVLTTEGTKWMQSVQKYCCLIFSWACRDSEDEKSNKINSNVMEQSAGSTYAVGLWGCQAPHPRLQPMWTIIVVGHIKKLEQPMPV